MGADKSQKYPLNLPQIHTKSQRGAEMEKSYKGNNSYSDLFEDFFRADAGAEAVDVIANSSTNGNDLFEGLISGDNNNNSGDFSDQQFTTQLNFNDFYLNNQQAQIEQQQLMMQPFYHSAGQMPLYAFAPSMPIGSNIQKPGFIRNRTRKNMRQKSVATAVKASHLMGSAGQAGSGYPLIQNCQPRITEIPYYQMAAQLHSYQSPTQLYMDNQKIQSQSNNTTNQPPLLLAKSPSTAAPPLLRPSNNNNINNNSSLSPQARSPNGTSSDYVKMRLQQKIRSRMVSKGQIPPNPTEEELRLCGVQIPGNSQLPTPKSSPQQIPRAFNQVQYTEDLSQPPVQDDLMKYLDLTNYSEQKDPLALPVAQINSLKQNQLQSQLNLKQQNQEFLYFNQLQRQQQHQQFQTHQDQMDSNNGSQISTNYDQFFSDFILY